MTLSYAFQRSTHTRLSLLVFRSSIDLPINLNLLSKMQFKSVLLALAAASAVVATPTPKPDPFGFQPWGCLTDKQATAIVNTFIQVEQTNGNATTTFNSLIESVANSDDQEISDSINFFTGTS